ncbi:hypothetical protein Glove_195g19 [Diversispora epigaea]|uniref:Protein kinase domain-containing protein n=1 Tax=Diversispora epigaea TaxID=1348612 RepID=A0A397IQR5_9GLOM|nr:hypothetical protein Glove_195g19 [Diversispora epigaea]
MPLQFDFMELLKIQKHTHIYDEVDELDIVHHTYIAPEVLSGEKEYTKAADIYSFGIIAYEMITGFPPYPDLPHDLATKICNGNGLRPKIPFHTPKLITRIIMYSEIRIQIENSEKLFKNQGLKNLTTTPFNYQTPRQAIYTSRLDFSNLPKPKNEEIFEELTFVSLHPNVPDF